MNRGGTLRVAASFAALALCGCAGEATSTSHTRDPGDASGVGGSSDGSRLVGSGGSIASGGSSDSTGGLDARTCPGTGGPSMVRIPAPDGTSYCIDSTEVTNRQYMEFLGATKSGRDGGAAAGEQDPWCAWNTDYDPKNPNCAAKYDPDARANYPVVCIDWCDAVAYCKWAGKHLCGRIGGGSTPFASVAEASASEWFNACSSGGTQAFPYGNTFDAAACVGNSYDGVPGYQSATDMAREVGSAAGCVAQPPYSEAFDLSGNVWEWEDSCEGANGANDLCRARGGAYLDGNSATDTRLMCNENDASYRNYQDESVGFRCCVTR